MKYFAGMPYPKYAMLLLAVITLAVTGRAQSAQDVDSLEAVYRRLPDDTVKAKTLYDLAFTLVQSNPEAAMQKTHELMRLSVKINFPKGRAMALDVQGNIYRMQGKYMDAVSRHFEALHIYDSLGFRNGYRNVLVNTGSDYTYLKNYPKAIEFFNRALALSDTGDYIRQIIIHNNIGNAYIMQGLYDSALKVYQKALPYAEKDKVRSYASILYSSLSIAYAGKGDFKNAITYMEQALVDMLILDNKNAYASSASTLGGYYIEVKNYRKAEYYLEAAYKAASELKAKSIIANYYRNKAHLLSRMGKYSEAYPVLEQYLALNDSLVNEQHISQLAQAEANYNLESKNRELALLNADKALKESELRLQAQLRYGLLILLVAMATAIFFLYRNIQLKKQTNKNLEDANSLMQKENILAQYETLRNQVNPHFLFNSLNALSSLIKQNPDRAIEFAGIFSRLYRSVLDLKDHAVITLAEEMRLVDDYMYLQKIRFEEKLVLEKNIPAHLLQDYIPPFCIQMLIENAIKHNIISAEQKLVIKLYAEGNWLVVSNNLQPRQQKLESTGVGIKNITARFRIVHNVEPQFHVVNNEYVAKIPLIIPQE